MFYVYGVSMKECRKLAFKKVNELFHQGKFAQDEFESEVVKLTNELFKSSKPKSISGQLSCPKRVSQFLELARKDASVRDLKAMKKVIKLDSGGNEVLTKKTKKPVFQIVQMSELEL